MAYDAPKKLNQLVSVTDSITDSSLIPCQAFPGDDLGNVLPRDIVKVTTLDDIQDGVLSKKLTASSLTTVMDHLVDTTNPHDVTKTQVGLGNVQNVDQTNASNITSGTLSSARIDSSIARIADPLLAKKTSLTGAIGMPAGTDAQRDGTPEAGYFRFNTSSSSFEGYDGTKWSPVAGQGLQWANVATSQLAVKNSGYFVNTVSAGITITLPASPVIGDQVSVVDIAGTFETNNCILGRNGKNIMGLAEDFYCDVNYLGVLFVYSGTSYGWKIVYTTSVGRGQSGGIEWNVVATNIIATSNQGYLIDTSAATRIIILPGVPEAGDTIIIGDLKGTFGTNNVTVDNNGSLIMGIDSTMTLDVDNQRVTLVYARAEEGWIITDIEPAADAESTTVARTSDTGSAVIPSGTTAQQDASPVAGYFRFNTSTSTFEGYNGTSWKTIATTP